MTTLTPEPIATPYGVEGYKSIAYEIYFQLGEQISWPGRRARGGAATFCTVPGRGSASFTISGANSKGPLPMMVAAVLNPPDAIRSCARSR